LTSSKQATEGPSGCPGGAAPSPSPSPGTVVGIDHKAILTEVRANLAKLDSCQRHEFVGLREGAIRCKDGFAFRDYRCANCGGKVDSHAERWYRRGIEHGKGGAR